MWPMLYDCDDPFCCRIRHGNNNIVPIRLHHGDNWNALPLFYNCCGSANVVVGSYFISITLYNTGREQSKEKKLQHLETFSPNKSFLYIHSNWCRPLKERTPQGKLKKKTERNNWYISLNFVYWLLLSFDLSFLSWKKKFNLDFLCYRSTTFLYTAFAAKDK